MQHMILPSPCGILWRLLGPEFLQAAGLPSGSGREVLLSWLAGVAAANEPRCKGGEYSALQHLLGECIGGCC
jgi:hypothetical protein